MSTEPRSAVTEMRWTPWYDAISPISISCFFPAHGALHCKKNSGCKVSIGPIPTLHPLSGLFQPLYTHSRARHFCSPLYTHIDAVDRKKWTEALYTHFRGHRTTLYPLPSEYSHSIPTSMGYSHSMSTSTRSMRDGGKTYQRLFVIQS